MVKEKIKAKIYYEDANGKLKLVSFNPKIIVKETEHSGHLMDGRPLVMSIIDGKEYWYFPHKYQRGKR